MRSESSSAAPLRLAGEEAGGEEIARAGRVDHFGDRLGRDRGALAALNGDRALLAARDDQGLDPGRDRGDRRLEIGGAGEHHDLGFIGEEDVDAAAVDQLVEAVAMAVDAEAVGKREGDLAARRPRHLDRPHHRVARRFRVPEIAFEIEHAAPAICASSSALAGRSCAAPRKVFIVRCASGVTRIIERAVGTPKSVAGVVNSTPVAVKSWR